MSSQCYDFKYVPINNTILSNIGYGCHMSYDICLKCHECQKKPQDFINIITRRFHILVYHIHFSFTSTVDFRTAVGIDNVESYSEVDFRLSKFVVYTRIKVTL